MSVLILSVPAPRSVWASGEVFTLSATPNWTYEGAPTAVSLTLTVNNAQMGVYSFNWTVTDPSGKSTSMVKNTASTVSSWSQTAAYPSDFGVSPSLVGIYNVNVAELVPNVNPSVGTTQFQIGLTDHPTYTRYSTVVIEGSGYVPLDNVTIHLAQGTNPVPGFPSSKNATTSGSVIFTWQTYPSTPLGKYNVSLTGKNTPAKNPPDTQQLTLFPTNTTVSRLLTSTNALERSQNLFFEFNATYLNGSPATTGTAQLQLTEPDGRTNHTIIMAYNNTQRSFAASYQTTLASSTGIWTASLKVRSFDDGYGNGGPLSPVVATFTVQNAILTVIDGPVAALYSTGSIISINSKVQTPAGWNFAQGTVTATLSVAGRNVVAPISLVYDQTQGLWTGSYKVNAIDPPGTWLLTVSAGDGYGNSGQTTSSFDVATSGIQSPQSPFAITWLWLIPVLVVAGLGFGMLILRRRGAFHREVKLDLKAIHNKADEVKSDDFLQSIRAQLKRRMDRMDQDKEQEKHD